MTRSQKFILGAVGAIMAGTLLVKLTLTLLISPAYFEKLLEENLNCNVEIEGVSVRLLRRELALRAVSLHPLDSLDATTSLQVGEIELGVKLLPLFSRRLETTRFHIEEPKIRGRFQENGDFSLADLFRVPREKKDDQEERDDKESSSSSPKDPTREKVLPADRNRWLAKLAKADLQNGSVELAFEKEELTLQVTALSIAVQDLRFNPEELRSLNEVDLALAGNATLWDKDRNPLVRLDLSGTAGGKLFDENSGEFQPDLLTDLTLGPDSHIEPRVKIVQEVWSYTDKVNDMGLRIGRLPERINFGNDRRINVYYREGKATLRKPLSLAAGIWELRLASESWIESFSGSHEIGIEFLAGGQAGKLASEWSQKLPKEIREIATTRFLADNRALWRIDSSGELSDPEFNFLSQLPEAAGLLKDLEDSVEEEVERFEKKAKSLLNDLLDF